MKNNYIDLDLTNNILNNINNGVYDHVVPVEVKDIPGIDGENIIDRQNLETWQIELNTACNNLRRINPDLREYLLGSEYGTLPGGNESGFIRFTKKDLERIGIQLYPYTAYGILNGGSATSYIDDKKNNSLNPELMRLYKSLFEKSSKKAAGKPKGVTPAYTNHDGSSGASFIELKLRALLIENLRYRTETDPDTALFPDDFETKKNDALFPMFQMTSVYNDSQISEALEAYRESPLLKDLIELTGCDFTKTLTGIQPMIAALTHSSVGKPKQIFTEAWGRDGEMLPLPGGHGQNFLVLSKIYKYLYEKLGKRFVYLGNVDNIGNMPDPVAIALTAISGKQASFEFSFRTPVDIKGGILITDQFGRLNCADIGPAVSREEVDRQEASGRKILYNCATGLFNLEYLTENIDHIIKNLPMRITDQNKDAGRYSQAEQVTWEVIGMLNSPLILGVNKYERYLAAKLLLESLMTSGLLLDDKAYPEDENPSKDFKKTAENLYAGLRHNLEKIYGMENNGNRWRPLSVDQLVKEIRKY